MKILTTRQTAKELGVSLTTVYSYIYEGKLKAHKLGGYSKRRHWRIKEEDLEAFINNGQEAGTRQGKQENSSCDRSPASPGQRAQ